MSTTQLIFGLIAGFVITCLASLLASQQIISWTLAIVGMALFAANGLTLVAQRLPLGQLKAVTAPSTQATKR